jgi:hypothetical protein
MVDKSEKSLESELKNVCLSDGRSIGIKLALKFRVFNSDHFTKRLMGERDKLFLNDVRDETVSGVICRKILPKLQKRPATDFASEEFVEKAKSSIEAEIKKRFKEWGLLLTSLTASFSAAAVESENDECTCEKESEEPDGAVQAGKNEKRGGMTTIEEELSDLENERAEREVVMELEKKQTQKDMDDALEAMELKEIQEKKKQLKEGGVKAEEKRKLEDDLENLKKAKDITERKFYKKELSEEAFQHMMEDFEKRIIEIETKLRKR